MSYFNRTTKENSSWPMLKIVQQPKITTLSSSTTSSRSCITPRGAFGKGQQRSSKWDGTETARRRHEDGTLRPASEEEQHELSNTARTLMVSNVLQSEPISAKAVGKRRLRAERKELEAVKEYCYWTGVLSRLTATGRRWDAEQGWSHKRATELATEDGTGSKEVTDGAPTVT